MHLQCSGDEGSQSGFLRLFTKTIAVGEGGGEIAIRDVVLQYRRGVCFATGWSGVVGRVRGRKAWTMRNEGEHEHEVMARPAGALGLGRRD